MWRVLGTLVAGTSLVLAGCSDDPARDTSPSTGSQLDCAALITDDALAALGWRTSETAEEHAGRCVRRAAESGAVTVATRAVTATGDDASGQVLDQECEELRSGSGSVAQPVGWLEPEREASCASELEGSRTGVAELYFLNDRDEVVQIRVEALAPVPPARLHAGLVDLAATAANLTY